MGQGAGEVSRESIPWTLSQASTDENRKKEDKRRGVQTGILGGPRATRMKQLTKQ